MEITELHAELMKYGKEELIYCLILVSCMLIEADAIGAGTDVLELMQEAATATKQ